MVKIFNDVDDDDVSLIDSGSLLYLSIFFTFATLNLGIS